MKIITERQVAGDHRDARRSKGKREVKKTEYSNVLKGITVQDLTPGLRDKLDIPENVTGVVVTDVAPNSPTQVCCSQ